MPSSSPRRTASTSPVNAALRSTVGSIWTPRRGSIAEVERIGERGLLAGTSSRRPQARNDGGAALSDRASLYGSPGRTRTYNLVVNRLGQESAFSRAFSLHFARQRRALYHRSLSQVSPA